MEENINKQYKNMDHDGKIKNIRLLALSTLRVKLRQCWWLIYDNVGVWFMIFSYQI